MSSLPKIIVIGGGFGGINVIKKLKDFKGEILLLDKTNHHLFQPLLYQVATSALSVDNIASPLREIVKKQLNTTVLMANVNKIDLENQKLFTDEGESYSYDYLVLAPGARHSYFGNDKWENFAPGLKTLQDGVKIREQVLLAFEKAESSENEDIAKTYMNFVVVGGGSTGVEIAGALAELTKKTLYKNFRRIKPEKSHIYLIEGADQILPGYPKKLAQKAKRDLESLDIEVWINTKVVDVSAEGVSTIDKFIPAKNIFWAAGNAASPLLNTLKVPLDKQGRVIVKDDLSITNHPNVFVIGDAANFLNGEGKPLPAIAPVAIQQAHYVAKVIRENEIDRSPFKYFDKGMISTIGRGKAVGVFRKIQISGYLAWLIWGGVHIFYLVSFRYRFFVFAHWLLLYIANLRLVRVILSAVK